MTETAPPPIMARFGALPICYECHRVSPWIAADEWSRRTGEPLDSSGFPLHLALFWYCTRCDITGARLVLP